MIKREAGFTCRQAGQIFILSLIVLTLVLINTTLIISNALLLSQTSNYSIKSFQAGYLAEAGVDKAIASLNKSPGSYNGEPKTLLGEGEFEVKISNLGSNKLIESTGYIPNKASPKAKRSVKIQISKGEGISFIYGVQVGEGGLLMQNNSLVKGIGGTLGNIYSNGSVVMENGARITGDAYSATQITGTSLARIEGNAHASSLNGIAIYKDAYYLQQSSIIVSGQSCDNLNLNTHCHPGSPVPSIKPMPITAEDISRWTASAKEGGEQSSINGCIATLGPKKINGFVKITNNCTTTVKTPVWITGDLELDNGAVMNLDSSYGINSGVIVVNGKIKLSNNGRLQGSGSQGSYMMGLSTLDSKTSGVVAIEADNGSISSILYAGDGIILLKNNASLQEVTGWKIQLDNNATIEYKSGLADQFFSSGPSGSYSVVKGTYQEK